MKHRDSFAMFSIAIFSVIGVGLAVVQKTYAFPSGTPVDNYVTAMSVCIGLFVVVISLIEWGTGNSVRADALHRNAEELNRLQRKVGQVLAACADEQVLEADEIDRLRNEYEEIKMQCPFNHEPIDHKLFLAQKRFSPEFSTIQGQARIGWFQARSVELASFLSAVWYFGIFWIVIATLLWITPWTAR
jgi:hypothetical protein